MMSTSKARMCRDYPWESEKKVKCSFVLKNHPQSLKLWVAGGKSLKLENSNQRRLAEKKYAATMRKFPQFVLFYLLFVVSLLSLCREVSRRNLQKKFSVQNRRIFFRSKSTWNPELLRLLHWGSQTRHHSARSHPHAARSHLHNSARSHPQFGSDTL